MKSPLSHNFFQSLFAILIGFWILGACSNNSVMKPECATSSQCQEGHECLSGQCLPVEQHPCLPTGDEVCDNSDNDSSKWHMVLSYSEHRYFGECFKPRNQFWSDRNQYKFAYRLGSSYGTGCDNGNDKRDNHRRVMDGIN
mgnify:CR=1 FL=1